MWAGRPASAGASAGRPRPASGAYHHRGTEDTERTRRALNRRGAENAETTEESASAMMPAGGPDCRLSVFICVHLWLKPPGPQNAAFICVHLRFHEPFAQAGKPVPPPDTVGVDAGCGRGVFVPPGAQAGKPVPPARCARRWVSVVGGASRPASGPRGACGRGRCGSSRENLTLRCRKRQSALWNGRR